MRLLFLAVITAIHVHADPRFHGVISGPKGILFAVSDAGETSRWVRVGDTVAGLKVESYDDRAESLTLRRASEAVVLRLPTSIIRGSDGMVAGTSAALRGIEFAFALALAGDQQMADMVILLERATAERMELARQVEEARAAQAATKSDESRIKASSLTRHLNTKVQVEANLRARLIEVSESKRPNLK